MKTIELPIPEGYKAEWVDGVLTLLPEINIGDTVTADRDICFYALDNFHIAKAGTPLKVTGYAKDICTLEHDGAATTADVRCLKPTVEAAPEPQDITERIKTFDDAYKWCKENELDDLIEDSLGVEAHLKLKIITAALNEGWNPHGSDNVYTAFYNQEENGKVEVVKVDAGYCNASMSLCFKSKELAKYAAEQFSKIYADYIL